MALTADNMGARDLALHRLAVTDFETTSTPTGTSAEMTVGTSLVNMATTVPSPLLFEVAVRVSRHEE